MCDAHEKSSLYYKNSIDDATCGLYIPTTDNTPRDLETVSDLLYCNF